MKRLIAILLIVLIIYLMISDEIYFYTFLFIACAMGIGYMFHDGGKK